jgi:hypothetical protein
VDITTPETVEQHVAALQDALTMPLPGECVFCFIDRMLDEFGCDTSLRWARRWRNLRVPRATGLERRLGARGGYCDCEIFLNGWDLRPELQVPDENGELQWPRPRPDCARVGPSSSQPCGKWVPQLRRRGWW